MKRWLSVVMINSQTKNEKDDYNCKSDCKYD